MGSFLLLLTKTASNVALSLIMKLLTEKFLKKFMRELIISALRKYAKSTESQVDDRLVVMVEEAFAEDAANDAK